MENWKTTVLGILVAVVGLINLVAKLLRGESITMADILIVIGAFGAGGGLAVASDGSQTKKMMKALKNKGIIMPLILILLPVMLFGCATPWQNKLTSSYVTALSLVKVSEQTAQPSCDVNTFPADKCGQLKKIYGDIKPLCKVAGETLILSFVVTDKAQLAAMLVNYQDSLAKIQTLVNEYIDIYNAIMKDRKGALPKGMIPAALIPVIIQAFISLMSEMPNLINAFNTWNLSSVDIAVLTTQINAAYAALPVWN